ncbi:MULTISPECIES: TOBE domain-containing protein [Brevibacterium]|uniref:MerR family transcriptional regulator n=1 Tax=Brevibacterium luteolum TaxID=199591 RepID=A0A2N6PK86_9MICO|nr:MULTISPECIES: TOBE domain-containing protein [Brevibacterium]MBU8577704.1 TOBE domain-containing protein [Brevibacterium luteolum]MCT1657222.1 TOBE domain-containing protein [Brevibacterium luteolum]MCT1690278.1 TOBE domain-containing protein [Brevibacterium sp. p3-SID960]PMB99110.1 MerR family transcriptional regulator [Brevibacterium luteolum]QIN28572.1 MerR family transcriptional regulator [Brevibacterium luteolum]
MADLRISDAALFMGVSDDTLRRWIHAGKLSQRLDGSGRAVVDGAELAELARTSAVLPKDPAAVQSSARNRFVGLVTAVKKDGVMAQVDVQCGPHRVVSLMSAEAVEELELTVGDVTTAVVKATQVLLEMPRR